MSTGHCLNCLTFVLIYVTTIIENLHTNTEQEMWRKKFCTTLEDN